MSCLLCIFYYVGYVLSVRSISVDKVLDNLFVFYVIFFNFSLVLEVVNIFCG